MTPLYETLEPLKCKFKGKVDVRRNKKVRTHLTFKKESNSVK